MRKRTLRVLGCLLIVGCFGTLGCVGNEVNTEALREEIKMIFGQAVVDIGTAVFEARVEAVLD